MLPYMVDCKHFFELEQVFGFSQEFAFFRGISTEKRYKTVVVF